MRPLKTLLISHESPVLSYGGGQRALTLKRAFESLGECRLLCLVARNGGGAPVGADYIGPSDAGAKQGRLYWRMRHLLFSDFRAYAPALKRVEEIRREYPFDIVACHLFAAARAAPVDSAPCFLDSDMTPSPTSRLTELLWPLTLRAMNARAKKFRRVFVIRPSDQQILRRAKTTYLPCVSASATAPIEVAPDARNLLFVANIDSWPPNRDAAEYLVREIAPRLTGTGRRLRLVGRGSQDYSGAENVSAAGFVDDLSAEYRNAAVVLCPIWSGEGANVKLAEALQYGAAVVATEHAAGGFAGLAQPGEHLLAGRTRQDFADILIGLLKSPERMRRLRANAARLGATILSQANLNAIVARTVIEELAINGQPA